MPPANHSPAIPLSVRDFFARLLWATRRTADGDKPFSLAFLTLADGRVEAGMRDGDSIYKTVSALPVAGFDGHRAGVIDGQRARAIITEYFGALRADILKRAKGGRK